MVSRSDLQRIHQSGSFERLRQTVLGLDPDVDGDVYCLGLLLISSREHARGDIEQSLAFLREVEARAEDRDFRGMAQLRIGFQHGLHGRLVKAESRLLLVMRDGHRPEIEADAANSLAFLYYSSCCFDSARAVYDHAVGLYREHGNRMAAVALYSILGAARCRIRTEELAASRKLWDLASCLREEWPDHSADQQGQLSLVRAEIACAEGDTEGFYEHVKRARVEFRSRQLWIHDLRCLDSVVERCLDTPAFLYELAHLRDSAQRLGQSLYLDRCQYYDVIFDPNPPSGSFAALRIKNPVLRYLALHHLGAGEASLRMALRSVPVGLRREVRDAAGSCHLRVTSVDAIQQRLLRH